MEARLTITRAGHVVERGWANIVTGEIREDQFPPLEGGLGGERHELYRQIGRQIRASEVDGVVDFGNDGYHRYGWEIEAPQD